MLHLPVSYSTSLITGNVVHSYSQLRSCAWLMSILHCSVTPDGHRVSVYWDTRRAVRDEEWDGSIVAGLLNSLCFLPLLSYGSTAPLAAIPQDDAFIERGWATEPLGIQRLKGDESDHEDGVLKVE